jgi:hypothetical protein
MKKTQTVSLKPQAFISINKSRLQNSENKYFLTENSEFEIELFNPLNEKIEAKISINGKNINSSLILYPGQRVFLERFLDRPDKFKYITYTVDGSKESLSAIEFNGDIEISFHKEIINLSSN